MDSIENESQITNHETWQMPFGSTYCLSLNWIVLIVGISYTYKWFHSICLEFYLLISLTSVQWQLTSQSVIRSISRFHAIIIIKTKHNILLPLFIDFSNENQFEWIVPCKNVSCQIWILGNNGRGLELKLVPLTNHFNLHNSFGDTFSHFGINEFSQTTMDFFPVQKYYNRNSSLETWDFHISHAYTDIVVENMEIKSNFVRNFRMNKTDEKQTFCS